MGKSPQVGKIPKMQVRLVQGPIGVVLHLRVLDTWFSKQLPIGREKEVNEMQIN